MQFHTFKKACVSVYPTTVQNDIVWFWPNTDPQYEDIITKKQPPYIPELDDPSNSKLMGNRDIPYGYATILLSTFLFLLPFSCFYHQDDCIKLIKIRIKGKKKSNLSSSSTELCIEHLDYGNKACRIVVFGFSLNCYAKGIKLFFSDTRF